MQQLRQRVSKLFVARVIIILFVARVIITTSYTMGETD